MSAESLENPRKMNDSRVFQCRLPSRGRQPAPVKQSRPPTGRIHAINSGLGQSPEHPARKRDERLTISGLPCLQLRDQEHDEGNCQDKKERHGDCGEEGQGDMHPSRSLPPGFDGGAGVTERRLRVGRRGHFTFR